jgi:hypothetical protein
MSDCNDQTDEGMILREEVSDEAVEAACGGPRGLPTLMRNTYCFACPSLQSTAKLLSKDKARRLVVNTKVGRQCPGDLKRQATAHWRRFVSVMKLLPPGEAEALWQQSLFEMVQSCSN